MAKAREKSEFKVPGKSDSSDKNVLEIPRDSSTVASSGLEAIQEILFGEQLKSSDEQISELQRNNEETSSNLSKLSNSVDQRFDNLTNDLNQKFEALVEQLLDHKNNQYAADERLSDSINACNTAFTQSIESTRESLNVQLNRMANEIEDKKLDRGKLSEMFEQVAKDLASNPAATTPSNT